MTKLSHSHELGITDLQTSCEVFKSFHKTTVSLSQLQSTYYPEISQVIPSLLQNSSLMKMYAMYGGMDLMVQILTF